MQDGFIGFDVVCIEHNAQVISAADIDSQVNVRVDSFGSFALDVSDLYCTGGDGGEHRFIVVPTT